MSIAEVFAAKLGNDGMRLETDDGVESEDLAERMDAVVTYSAREYTDDIDQPYEFVDGYVGTHISDDPIRFEFDDGSAVVVAGAGWDIEGEERFSWEG